jgi:hypothetical protein
MFSRNIPLNLTPRLLPDWGCSFNTSSTVQCDFLKYTATNQTRPSGFMGLPKNITLQLLPAKRSRKQEASEGFSSTARIKKFCLN